MWQWEWQWEWEWEEEWEWEWEEVQCEVRHDFCLIVDFWGFFWSVWDLGEARQHARPDQAG